MGRLKAIRTERIPTLRIGRLKAPEMPPQLSPGLIERKSCTGARAGRSCAAGILNRNPTCMFCGAPSRVAEHLVGHNDATAVRVAEMLGLPPIAPTWRERFWSGPFCGACLTARGSGQGFEVQIGWRRAPNAGLRSGAARPTKSAYRIHSLTSTFRSLHRQRAGGGVEQGGEDVDLAGGPSRTS